MAIIKYFDIVQEKGLNVPGENPSIMGGVETLLIDYEVPAGAWNVTGFIVTGDVDCEAVLIYDGQRQSFARTSSANRMANPLFLGGAIEAVAGKRVQLAVIHHEPGAKGFRGNIFGFTKGT